MPPSTVIVTTPEELREIVRAAVAEAMAKHEVAQAPQSWQQIPPSDAPIFLTEPELQKAMGVSRQTLYEMRNASPPQIGFVKFGPRVVRYPLSELPEAIQREFLRARSREGVYAAEARP